MNLPTRDSMVWNVLLTIGVAFAALGMLPESIAKHAYAPAWFPQVQWYALVVGFILGVLGAKNGNSMVRDR